MQTNSYYVARNYVKLEYLIDNVKIFGFTYMQTYKALLKKEAKAENIFIESQDNMDKIKEKLLTGFT